MKVKDLTIEQAKAICKKARTKPNGKVKDMCTHDCPLNTRSDFFDTSLRACDIINILNMEVEVLENET